MAGIPSDAKDSGTYAHNLAKRDAAIATNPHLAAKILGKRPSYVAAKEHWIAVDCRTGLRVIKSPEAPKAVPPPPAPPPVQQYVAPRGRACHRIIAAVCRAWEVTEPETMSKGRQSRVVRPRFACYLLLRDRLGWSMPQIGRYMHRDHSTVKDGLKQASKLQRRDRDWGQRYDAALAELKGSAP